MLWSRPRLMQKKDVIGADIADTEVEAVALFTAVIGNEQQARTDNLMILSYYIYST